MSSTCGYCGERFWSQVAYDLHLRDRTRCAATQKTFVYLRHGLRPMPEGHTVPAFLVVAEDETRAAWEGEPRASAPLLARAERQEWVPAWVDAIVAAWSAPIAADGAPRRAQRDRLLAHVATRWSSIERERLVDAAKEGAGAVIELCRAAVEGPLPS